MTYLQLTLLLLEQRSKAGVSGDRLLQDRMQRQRASSGEFGF
jgi:hypothetical protein